MSCSSIVLNVVPKLPDQYSMILEINRVETKETINVREYYDYKNQRVRTDVIDGAGQKVVIRDFKNNMRYTIQDGFLEDDPTINSPFDDTCTREPLATAPVHGLSQNGGSAHSKAQAVFEVSGATLHMKDPSSMFLFNATGKERFLGNDYARGIKPR